MNTHDQLLRIKQLTRYTTVMNSKELANLEKAVKRNQILIVDNATIIRWETLLQNQIYELMALYQTSPN